MADSNDGMELVSTLAYDTKIECEMKTEDVKKRIEAKGLIVEIRRDCFQWKGTKQEYLDYLMYKESRYI